MTERAILALRVLKPLVIVVAEQNVIQRRVAFAVARGTFAVSGARPRLEIGHRRVFAKLEAEGS